MHCKFVLFFLSLAFLFGEVAPAQTDNSKLNQLPFEVDRSLPILVLERAGCLGPCPEYSISFYKDGRIVYEGHRYVTQTGIRADSLSPSSLTRLTSKLRGMQFQRFRDTYSYHGCGVVLSDYAWTTFRVNLGKQKKNVERFHGCSGGSERFQGDLRKLDELEKYLESLVAIERWIGTQEERDKIKYREPSIKE